LGPGGTCQLGDPRAWHKQRQLGAIAGQAAPASWQVLETLSTADHQPVQAFRFDASWQFIRA
jgi:hypothetical protein